MWKGSNNFLPYEDVKMTSRCFTNGSEEAGIQNGFRYLIGGTSIDSIHFIENNALHFECS